MTLNIDRGGVILAPFYVIGFRSPPNLVTLGWHLAAFVLFAASAVAVLEDAAAGGAGLSLLIRFAVCGIVFLWHVTSGIQHLYSNWFA